MKTNNFAVHRLSVRCKTHPENLPLFLALAVGVFAALAPVRAAGRRAWRWTPTIGSDAHGDPDEMTKLLVGAGKRAVSEALKALQQNQLLRTDRTSRWGM